MLADYLLINYGVLERQGMNEVRSGWYMSFHIKAAMEEMGHYDIYTRVYMVINYSDRCWCGSGMCVLEAGTTTPQPHHREYVVFTH